MKKIMLLSDLSRDPDRMLIQGLTKYGLRNEKWAIYPVSPSFREDPDMINVIIEKAKHLKVDAICGMWPCIEYGENNLGLSIPIVLKPRYKSVRNFSSLHANADKIGRMAADFFKRAGIINVTSSGIQNTIWSDERIKAFTNYAHGNLYNGIKFSISQVDYQKVSKWLVSLPKPIGIFACNDVNASIIIEVCHGLRFRIPEDVAILGVDNDRFLCNTTSPSISSIQLDYEKAGFELAKKLMEVIENNDNSIFTIIHDPINIIERESTPSYAIKDIYIKKIVDYMDANFTKVIGIKDAIADIPLSRRSIEMRFKTEFGNVTMHEYLTTLRIEHLKKLLATTNLTLMDATSRSGFSEIENIYRIFKKYVGCTPAEYRQIHSGKMNHTDKLAET